MNALRSAAKTLTAAPARFTAQANKLVEGMHCVRDAVMSAGLIRTRLLVLVHNVVLD